MSSTFRRGLMMSYHNHWEPEVRTHLTNVYGCLCLTTLTAGLAAIFGLLYPELYSQPHFFTFTHLGEIGLIVALSATHGNKERMLLRFNILLILAVCLGLNLIPMLKFTMIVDPAVIVTALLSTSVVFVSFSLCSLFSERGKWLFLAAPIMSFFIFTIALMTTWLLFGIGFALLYNCNLYLGLFATCGCVLFDTQMIMEKRRLGDDDFVTHSLNLFCNFIGIFRRLLIILTERKIEVECTNKKKNDPDKQS
ncbi:hypothetical protein B566_EDAN007529 [Ephemera danica]|nr:hypothetical protein B566_EDAN007529 [Ephemera danica]